MRGRILVHDSAFSTPYLGQVADEEHENDYAHEPEGLPLLGSGDDGRAADGEADAQQEGEGHEQHGDGAEEKAVVLKRKLKTRLNHLQFSMLCTRYCVSGIIWVT